MGECWNNYTIQGAMGYDAKFIGFTDKQNGWVVSGGSAGVGRSLNYVYQTSDGGQTWEKLAVSLPETFNEYQKTPLSPILGGKEGLYPILLCKEGNTIGTIYLSSKDNGLKWTYDSSYDHLSDSK